MSLADALSYRSSVPIYHPDTPKKIFDFATTGLTERLWG